MKTFSKCFLVVSFILYILLAVYLLFIAYGRLIVTDLVFDISRLKNNMNIIPFKSTLNYINEYITGSLPFKVLFNNIVGNILVFAPLGFFIPYFVSSAHNLSRFILYVSAIILSVEFIQLVTLTGVMDIDDYILNLIGAIMAYLLSKYIIHPVIEFIEFASFKQ